MSKARVFGGIVVLGVIIGACSHHGDDTPQVTTPPAASSGGSVNSYVSTPSGLANAEPISAASGFTGEPVTVAAVIDGDTFKTTDGREIRVLGIDSCEKETYGGQLATSDAKLKLETGSYSGPITLKSQAGVDTDRYGRHLRYVQFGTNHEDFGEYMVRNDHTGVYQGRNDAAPDYVARLYSLDTEYSANPPSGKECGDPTPAPSSSGDSYSGGDDDNMPDGLLTGGYCAHKWWC